MKDPGAWSNYAVCTIWCVLVRDQSIAREQRRVQMVKDVQMVKYVQMVYWAAYEERLINDC